MALLAALEMFLRFGFGVIFTTSGWSKLRAGALPWFGLGLVEAAAGLAVLGGAWLRMTAPLLLALLLAFTAYLYRAWRRQTRKNCGCGGILGDAAIGQAILLRNGFLAAATLLLWLLVAGGGNAAGLDRLLDGGGNGAGLPAGAWAGTGAGLALGGAALALWLRFRPREGAPEG